MNQTEIASGCGVCMDDQCLTPLCSTSFGYDENYSISVTAFNSFGSLPPATFNENNIGKLMTELYLPSSIIVTLNSLDQGLMTEVCAV